ncbi:hypothetical protein BABINDRAFT_159961 [Babjeviella inositovora NRRL Y-12698]|uniref:C2H2-type domain-containing protein n=1 Tax=Babjeviella inositovora NRRL Y-12698 TaxID=984486 RepID=A0A1E3QVM2_9ASCO|nr:uncharacterized protein BABINDRAFT_159961 [Babjeviella inositovora NRRL Y-12698]ODQ81709.1 hypothetical protein BABINDRAFT_159961 [Babjeviella inositovora NRRL Y-12698]
MSSVLHYPQHMNHTPILPPINHRQAYSNEDTFYRRPSPPLVHLPSLHYETQEQADSKRVSVSSLASGSNDSSWALSERSNSGTHASGVSTTYPNTATNSPPPLGKSTSSLLYTAISPITHLPPISRLAFPPQAQQPQYPPSQLYYSSLKPEFQYGVPPPAHAGQYPREYPTPSSSAVGPRLMSSSLPPLHSNSEPIQFSMNGSPRSQHFASVASFAREHAHSSSSESISGTLSSKQPRKKRQCPECKHYFSNLATHKSTHLTPDSRPHVCSICDRGFSRSNDLSRHVKRHWKETGSDQGAFKCPFNLHVQQGHEGFKGPHGEGEAHDDNAHTCHLTGIFSRCDTFKNHLKALHFEYPLGTKKNQRGYVSGCCKSCKMRFNKVDDWMSQHVEAGKCPYGAGNGA